MFIYRKTLTGQTRFVSFFIFRLPGLGQMAENVMISMIGEDSLRSSNAYLPRVLFIFAGQVNNGYEFIFRNSTAIPCANCCGMPDPYAGMDISKNRIVIQEYCSSNWKSLSEYRFRHRPKIADWLPDTVVKESFSFDHDNYSLDTITQKDFGKNL